jgi:hypothetical protein
MSNESVPAESTDPRPEQTAPVPWTARVQAMSAVAAAFIAAVAAALSAIALIYQVGAIDRQAAAIRDQISANSSAREQRNMQYAVRVSWWIDDQANGLVKVQNRSVVPVRNAHLGYKLTLLNPTALREEDRVIERTFYFLIPVLPPCTIISFSTRENLFAAGLLVSVSAIELDKLWFSDASGDWSVTSGGQPKPSPPMVKDTGLGIGGVGGASKKSEQASNCGVG